MNAYCVRPRILYNSHKKKRILYNNKKKSNISIVMEEYR